MAEVASDGGSGSREERRILAQVDAFEQTAAKSTKREAKLREDASRTEVNRQVQSRLKRHQRHTADAISLADGGVRAVLGNSPTGSTASLTSSSNQLAVRDRHCTNLPSDP